MQGLGGLFPSMYVDCLDSSSSEIYLKVRAIIVFNSQCYQLSHCA